jgi:hypothetical protein
MFVLTRARSRDGFSLFGVRLGVVVPAWSAGIQVYIDVSGGVPAAWMPAVHAGMTDAVP